MPYLNVHGLTQYYELGGEGRPLVFVHGALVDHRCWVHQAEHFAATRQVLLYDLRGHGRTGPSEQPRYSIELFAEDLRALLAGLDLERPVICGHSLGGMVAQAYAARYPVAGLVLADTLAAVTLGGRDTLLRLLAYPRWILLPAARMLPRRWLARMLTLGSRLIHGEAWLGEHQSTRGYVRSCLLQLDGSETVKTLDAVYRFRMQQLDQIRAPCLVLLGEREVGIVRRHSEQIAGRIDGAKLEVIDRAGHLSNLDNPEAFNARVQELVSRTPD